MPDGMPASTVCAFKAPTNLLIFLFSFLVIDRYDLPIFHQLEPSPLKAIPLLQTHPFVGLDGVPK
jgi:hypothetical protein